jgi:hypothetical protein
MGPLIRLCLLSGVHLWFIPPAEPWRNGMVEKFNDHYRQKFLDKIPMASMPQFREASLAYEDKHNSTYRYSKLNGKTPLTALARLRTRLVFPDREQAPRHPLEKPGTGCYHLVHSSGAIAISTSSANCSPRHRRPKTNTLWRLSTSESKN